MNCSSINRSALTLQSTKTKDELKNPIYLPMSMLLHRKLVEYAAFKADGNKHADFEQIIQSTFWYYVTLKSTTAYGNKVTLIRVPNFDIDTP